MQGKVTGDQIKAANISMQEFRSAVNTQNTKNKGYVRFVPNGKGGVQIKKVNNKIDVLIGWRTNISRENNLAMREKFANAVGTALRWSDQKTVESLLAKIRETAHGETNIDALSRKEIESVLKAYDLKMNTSEGRKEMLDNILRSTAEKCGFSADDAGVAQLREKYLHLTGDLADLNWLTAKNGETGEMLKDELTFRNLLFTLEAACNEAVSIAKTDRVLETTMEGVLAKEGPKEDFGVHLGKPDADNFRAVLHHHLQQKGLFNKDVGRHNAIFDKFMTDVLPKLYEEGAKGFRHLEGVDQKLYMEANFSAQYFLDEAMKFMREAEAYLDSEIKYKDFKKIGDKEVDDSAQNLQAVYAKTKEQKRIVDIGNDVLKIVHQVNMNKKEAILAVDGMRQSVEVFKDEGRLTVFASKFLAERGIGKAIAETKTDREIQKAINKSMHDLFVGAQIVFGEDRRNGPDGIRIGGADKYFGQMENFIDALTSDSQSDYGETLKHFLLTYTMPNIMNRQIELAAAGITNRVGLISDYRDLDPAKALVRSTAEAFNTFQEKVEKQITAERNLFTKMLDVQLKKGLISEETCAKMHANILTTLVSAHQAAIEAFFLESPVEDVDVGTEKLNRLFREKLNDARAEIKNAIALNTLGNTVNVDQKATLLSSEDRIADAIAQPGFPAGKLGIDGVIKNDTALRMLKNGALKRLYSNILGDNLKKLKATNGTATLDDAFVKNVTEQFNKQALKLAKQAVKAGAHFINECKTLVKAGVENATKTSIDPNGELTRQERKAFIEEVTGEVMQYRATQLRTAAEKIFAAPESFTNEALEQMAVDFLNPKELESVDQAFRKIIEDRKQVIRDFFAGNGMEALNDKIFTTGVFGEKGPLGGIGYQERFEISGRIEDAVNKVVLRAKNLAAVYASSDRQTIIDRLATEIDSKLQDFAKSWSKVRSKLLAKIKPIEENYQALSQASRASVLDEVLADLVRSKNFPNVNPDDAVAAYTERIQLSAGFAIEKRTEAFEVYVQKVEAVRIPALEKLEAALQKSLDAACATATNETKAYFKDEILPKRMKQIEYLIYRNPDNFTAEKLEAREQELANAFMSFAGEVLRANACSSDDLIQEQFDALGVGTLNQHPTEKTRALADVNTWLTTEEGKAQRIAAEKALLNHLLEVANEQETLKVPADGIRAFTPSAENNPVTLFRQELSTILHNHALPLLHDAFDSSKIAETQKSFETWLNSYELSRNDDYRNTNSHERIMTEYAKRVAGLQMLLADGAPAEPILTPEFMAVIDRIIDSDGIVAIIQDWKNERMATWMATFTQDVAWPIFDPSRTGLSPELETAVRKNAEELRSAVSLAISTIASTIAEKGDINSVRADLKALTDEDLFHQVDEAVVETIEGCTRRYNLESGAEQLIQSTAQDIERKLIDRVIREQHRSAFSGGFISLFSHISDPKMLEGVMQAYNAFVNALTTTLAAELDRARTDDITLKAFEERLQTRTETFITTMLKDKTTWKNGLLPALKTIDKELK